MKKIENFEKYIFLKSIKSSFKLEYLKDNSIKSLDTYDFHMPENIFYKPSLNPENAGFCREDQCLGNGVFNISSCFQGTFFKSKFLKFYLQIE